MAGNREQGTGNREQTGKEFSAQGFNILTARRDCFNSLIFDMINSINKLTFL